MPIVVAGNVFVDIKGFPDNKYIPSGRNAGWVEIAWWTRPPRAAR